MPKLEPLWDRVMILAPSVSDGGIHLPRSLKAQHDMGRGTVVGVGAAVRRVKVGWDVYFTRGERIDLVTHDGEDYWLLPEALIVARVEPQPVPIDPAQPAPGRGASWFECTHGMRLLASAGEACGWGCQVRYGEKGLELREGLELRDRGEREGRRVGPVYVSRLGHPFALCTNPAHPGATVHCGKLEPSGEECGQPEGAHF